MIQNSAFCRSLIRLLFLQSHSLFVISSQSLLLFFHCLAVLSHYRHDRLRQLTSIERRCRIFLSIFYRYHLVLFVLSWDISSRSTFFSQVEMRERESHFFDEIVNCHIWKLRHTRWVSRYQVETQVDNYDLIKDIARYRFISSDRFFSNCQFSEDLVSF